MRPLRLDVTGTVDANGNLTIPVPLPVTGEWHNAKVTIGTTGPAEWAILVSGTVATYGRGRRVTLGPELVRDGETMTIVVSNAPPLAAILGAVLGKSGWAEEILRDYAPQPNTIAMDTSTQPGSLGTVSSTSGVSTTKAFILPVGTQSLAFTTTQTGGGALTGSAVLTFTDDDPVSPSLFFRQNPVVQNGWSWTRIVTPPSGMVAVTLDMTGVGGAGGQFTTEVVALPYVSSLGVVTDPGGSVALKPSNGNLIMATGVSQHVYGQLVAPAAGATVVASAALAIGHYRVRVRVGYGIVTDTIEDNMKLVLSGILSYTNLRVPMAANSLGVDRVFENLNVSSAAALHVETIGASVAPGAIYWATMDILPLSSS